MIQVGDKERTVYGMTGLTLRHIIERNSTIWPNKLAVVDIDGDKKYTFKELNARVNQLANQLLKMGIRRGDHIAYISKDGVECVEIMFAANKLGAVWVPVNYRYTDNEIISQLNHSDAVAVFFDIELAEVMTRISGELHNIPQSNFICIGESELFTSYESFIAEGSIENPSVHIKDTDACGVIYTSGTTGVPKGAIHSHRSIIGWALGSILLAGWHWKDRVLNPFPMFHLGGTVISIACMISGATNYMFGKFEVEKLLKKVEEEKITIMSVVPTILNAVLKLPEEEIKKYDWSSLRILSTSSAPLMSQTQEAALKYWPQINLYTFYSATELFFSILMPEDHYVKTRCVGKPSFGMDLKVVDNKGNEVGPDEIGLIYGKGISLFKGYYKNPEAEEKCFDGEWFTCDDLGYFDEDGYLYVVDRKKDIIISGGENISSVEIEDILIQNENILEAAVIGLPDDLWGERVHAVVSLKPHSSITGEEILEWCKDKMAGYKRPKSIQILPVLPKSPVGKILKRNLRDSAVRA